jgi:hypothetical protein
MKLYLDFVPEKGPLDVLLFWLVLHVVALSIDDGVQPPYQGLHEFYRYFLLSNLVQKSDFIDKPDVYF